MSIHLKRYLIDEYESRRASSWIGKIGPRFPIQIDDQDDNDNINEFCNIFCTVNNRNTFSLEISGNFPITQNISDLVEIYNGYVDTNQRCLFLKITTTQIDVIMDLAERIKKTALMGNQVSNPSWVTISARTISSLYRFVRIIKEYNQSRLIKSSLVVSLP